MLHISCVVIFVDDYSFTFTAASAEIQKIFNQFSNVDPQQLILRPDQTIDDVPNDIPVHIFSSDSIEVLLAKGRFTFVEHIIDDLCVEACCERIKNFAEKMTELLNNISGFVDLKYRLGIVIESDFKTKQHVYETIQKTFGNDIDLDHAEMELSVNDFENIHDFIINKWQRIYTNENGNTFLVDINNHINTPASYRDYKVDELYNMVHKDRLEVVLNDFLRN